MKVVETADGKCVLYFLKTHVGHQMELEHLKLTPAEREMIAQKLTMKIPFDIILDEIRESFNEESLKRMHLMDKKDLYNIESSFGINSNVIRNNDDAVIFESWINEMNADEGSCVIFYKPQCVISEQYPELQQDDFVLIIMNTIQAEMLKKYGSDSICIDGTHGLNSYNFELITLMVIDDMREGFPCGFLISNKSDEAVLSVFFDCIKNKVGYVEPKVFMSDMADSFFNSWIKKMNYPEHRLYCAWHVDQAWRKNLKKIKGLEKQIQCYKILRTLLEERDEKAFEIMLPEAILLMKNDADMADYGMYFESNYFKNSQSWAYCYRLHCGLNTNMHLERMHRTIKHVYLHGKTVKRLDKALHAVMQFVRDKAVTKLIASYKGKITSKVKDIRAKHKTSCNLTMEVSDWENGWYVSSSSSNEMYTIKKVKDDCKCALLCMECKSCIHQYICTCIDSAVKWNMCKHIHLVCRHLIKYKKDTEDMETNCDLFIIPEDSEKNMLIAELSKQCQSVEEPQNSVETLVKKKLEDEYSKIIDVATPSELQFLQKNLLYVKSTIRAMKNSKLATSSFRSKFTSSTNKKIEPQRRFFSTKKARKVPAKSIAKPKSSESNKIAMSLILKKKSI